ncbi:alcohol oxidase [Tothia fuscella]|uniref:Alcohol oxidase n=1 Tax=Tothia fuscella TaxID=1048955 RepID=A0A9P4NY58_9PEZI|nr:alcohol oxidase [Tothia fuscella]
MSPMTSISTFDYAIIGGGTAGLTIAARLTENPAVTVAVLEAGLDRSDDVTVLAPGLATVMYGNPEYDWIYETVPQISANGQVIGMPRGKQLGGSSAINLLFWTHSSRKDIDNWGRLGNKDWSWDAILPYFERSEKYIAPSAGTARDLNTSYINSSLHGRSGAIGNGFPETHGEFDVAWPQTYANLDLGVDGDPRDGVALGGYTNLINVDPIGSKRSYAATAYYLPAKERPNLRVITNAMVSKILFSKEHAPTATGVEYSINGTNYTLMAKREVILSAGSIGSPQILELSGIGAKNILEPLGIKSVIDNPGVGENLQDHIYIPIGYEAMDGIFTFDSFRDPAVAGAAFERYISNGTGPLATGATSSALLSYAQILSSGEKRSIPKCMSRGLHGLNPGLREQYALILEDLLDPNECVAQELDVPSGMSPLLANDTTKLFVTSSPGNYFSLLGVLEHPFSRGSIHVSSPNVNIYPTIDPRYLSHEADVEILSKIALHLQTVATTAPLSQKLKGGGTVYQPGYYHLNETNVEDFVRKYVQSEFHPIGTCAMLPKAKGGVVDEKLSVYGVKGLRVVDASIFPILPRANLQTLVYAVAERAAEWILEDLEGR